MAPSLELLLRTLDSLESAELKRFRTFLSERILEEHEPIPRGKLEHCDVTDVASKMQQAYGDEVSVKLTLAILRKMNLSHIANNLERNVGESEKVDGETFYPNTSPDCDLGGKDNSDDTIGVEPQTQDTDTRHSEAIVQEVKEKHKKWMIEKFGEIHECIEEGKTKTLLSKIYTELYFTEGESEGVNTQHEVCRNETQSQYQRPNKSKISCNDIFNTAIEKRRIRTVMTTGIAGIGKTVCVQKFILDWAEGHANQDVHFVFSLSFRQLNLIQNESYTLHKLLLDFYPELDENVINPDTYGKLKIIFIFDGLDESKLTLNIQHSIDIYNPLKTASVEVLIANLIKGSLLPSALLWITSRPAAVKRIPPKYIDSWTEVHGFNDQQKDEYFRKKIENESEANTAISHIKMSKSLYIMCHIPVFCWILANVIVKMIKLSNRSHLPQTLTEVYINFLLIETNRKIQKFDEGFEGDDRKSLETNSEAILKLSKLAYNELMKGNILFYENSLKESGISDDDFSFYSGMCSEFFQIELFGGKRKVFCFVHLSIQEFLAALFVFHSFVNKNTEALKGFTPEESLFTLVDRLLTGSFKGFLSKNSLACILKTAVDKSMQREDGQFDLFLRFLLGISLESNQKLLQGLLTCIKSSSDNLMETAQYIKRLLSEDTKSTERCMNLLLCLLEMKDSSLHEEIQQYINSGEELSPAQCTTLAYMLLVSEGTLDEFDLTNYKTTREGRQRLLIVLRACRKARLVDCDLRDDSCEALVSVLQSENVLLKELDLSSNPLGNSGMRMLSSGLNHTIRLETLRLADCKLADESCEIVATVLQSPNSLIELDLSTNDLGDSGVELLSKGLSSPHCSLQTLRLAGCQLTDKSCGVMAAVLQSPDSLKKLDLSTNGIGDSGVQLLSTGLSSFNCKLQTLRLSNCSISDEGYICLAVSLMLNPSCVGELDVSNNHPGESAQKLLSATLEDPHRKVETLLLVGCRVTDKSCDIVASVLQSPNSLIELDLSHNDLGDSGVQLLSKGLASPHCKLQTLRFDENKLSDKSCGIVATVLQSPNSLIELDLSHNDLGDSGVQLFSVGLSSPHCKLQTLRLSDCLITEKGCVCLASALTSNPSHLKELDLSYNHPGESGLKLLSARLEDPVCKLEILKTDNASLNRTRPRLLRYAGKLTLDPDTAGRNLSLSEGNGKVTWEYKKQPYPAHPEPLDLYVKEKQPYTDHPERFDSYCQVLCREGLCGRCYWEAEWSGNGAEVAVACKSIQRKVKSDDITMGCNARSWSLFCSPYKYSASHNNKPIAIPAPSSGSRRIGVYLDWPAGTLSFYSVSSDTLTHLHTFHSSFTAPLYPGFVVGYNTSVSLCQIT